MMRHCSRTACGRRAVATLTYNYADSTAVLGPLSTYAEPHSYDLCAAHAERTTAPRGWEVVRLVSDFTELPDPTDDLTAVADAVRSDAPRTPVEHQAHAEAVAGPPLLTAAPEPVRVPGKRYPERLVPLRRDVASGGGPAPRPERRPGQLRVLRDNEPWDLDRGAER